ncbi:MAG: CoA transferase [Dehalococcoidia bacterium]|nr:CoA transferase [Dehalococcoidia bacterium]
MCPALDGIRILDMAWFGPGPFCATLLGDLGAEIIKIHEPYPERRGGLIMYAFPEAPDFPGQRNCKTMGLDLKAESGRGIFYEMARTADVVFESYRPGVVKRLKVDYDTLKEINPGIVYTSLSGYGQDGPYRDFVGHDLNYISIAGLLGLNGPPDGPPVIPGTLVADFAGGGMAAAIGILAALMAREKTGKGQFVDVSMTDGIVELLFLWIAPYMNYGIESKRGETIFTGKYPWYNVYETKDGKYISVAAFETWFYANLCQLLGREDFVEYQFDEGPKQDEMFRYFKQTFMTKTRDEWVEILRSKDTCVAPVNSIDEVVNDPHLLARGMIRELPHPTMGTVKQVGSMLKLSDSPFEARNWATRFGQHTDEIMHQLGYDGERIHALREEEVIS